MDSTIYDKIRRRAVIDKVSTRQIISEFPGVSPASVRTMVARAWNRSDEPRPDSFEERFEKTPLEVISPLHARVGRVLQVERLKNNRYGKRNFALEVLASTAAKLTKFEQGTLDPTLSDLQRVAAYCKIPVSDLVKEPS